MGKRSPDKSCRTRLPQKQIELITLRLYYQDFCIYICICIWGSLCPPKSKLQGSFLLWLTLINRSAHLGLAQLQHSCISQWHQIATVRVGPEVTLLRYVWCEAERCANPLVNVSVPPAVEIESHPSRKLRSKYENCSCYYEFFHYGNFHSGSFSLGLKHFILSLLWVERKDPLRDLNASGRSFHYVPGGHTLLIFTAVIWICPTWLTLVRICPVVCCFFF